jgi:CheY-like chemotaxis protein
MRHIYLADDDVDDQLFFQEALKEVKFPTELTVAKDGNALMETLDHGVTEAPPPHVIFLDLNMPLKNGFECLREIRETPKLKNIPVIIFSTSNNADAIDLTYSLGANYYVCKPSSHKLLIKAIDTLLGLELWGTNTQIQKEKFVLSIN